MRLWIVSCFIMSLACPAPAIEPGEIIDLSQATVSVERLPVVPCSGTTSPSDPWMSSYPETMAPASSGNGVVPVSGISSDLTYSPQPAATYVGTPEIPDTSGGGWHPIHMIEDGNSWYRIDGWARGYYLNDQRTQWSGVEATLGAEGAIVPVLYHQFANSEATVLGEFYLNQPFNRNVLLDTPERRSYAANWEIETFQISQLSVAWRRNDFEATVGKMVTPFGRTYFPIYSNSRVDAPFIRSEAIHWRETGALLRYDPSHLICDAAVVNGCEDGDTNSAKGLVGRVGLQYENFAGGFSIKWQDGVGSEQQKEYNNCVGTDLMFRCGKWVLSGEAIYDQHGFHRPFDPDNITWVKSLYYRDLCKSFKDPITGFGYYVNLGVELERWAINLNYGEYYPEEIGVATHDIINRRGIVKADYKMTSCLNVYGVVMKETDGYLAQDGRNRVGVVVLTGMQYVF